MISAKAAITTSQAAVRTAETAADEARLRTRPWVGVVEIAITSSSGLYPENTLIFSYSNFGALPAHDLEGDLTISPAVLDIGPKDTTVFQDTSVSKEPVTESFSVGALFPQEPGIYRARLPSSSPFHAWRRIGFPINFSGRIAYRGEGNTYHTDFEGHIRFVGPDHIVDWWHTRLGYL